MRDSEKKKKIGSLLGTLRIQIGLNLKKLSIFFQKQTFSTKANAMRMTFNKWICDLSNEIISDDDTTTAIPNAWSNKHEQ